MSVSFVVCDLDPITNQERRELRQLVDVENHREAYMWLRDGTGRDQFSLQDLCEDLKISSRSLAQSCLAALAKLGLVERIDYPGQIEWHVRPVTQARPLNHGFRGANSIQVRERVPGLGSALAPSEEGQLFLALRTQPKAASLYRHLRRSLNEQITMTQLAQLYLTGRKTIKARMACLGNLGLLEEVDNPPTIIMNFADCEMDDEVDPSLVKEWLKTEAATPVPLGRNALLLKSLEPSKQSALILDFYYKAMAAKAKDGILAPGPKGANQHVAQILARSNNFTQLMPALLFFVFDWRSDALDRYGHSLMTFHKNLPAIVEELEADWGDYTYVQRTMKRAGLDQFFEVPEVKKRSEIPLAESVVKARAETAALFANEDSEEKVEYERRPLGKLTREEIHARKMKRLLGARHG